MLIHILNIIGGIGIVIGLILYHIHTEHQDTQEQQHWLDKQIDDSMGNNNNTRTEMRGKEWE